MYRIHLDHSVKGHTLLMVTHYPFPSEDDKDSHVHSRILGDISTIRHEETKKEKTTSLFELYNNAQPSVVTTIPNGQLVEQVQTIVNQTEENNNGFIIWTESIMKHHAVTDIIDQLYNQTKSEPDFYEPD